MQWLELKIPPPLITGIVGFGMWLAGDYTPSLAVAFPWRLEISWTLVVAGVLIDLSAFFAFRKARTTINPLKPANASAMVTRGIYRYSRNPMYLGLLLYLAGWAIYLSNPLTFAGLPLFVVAIYRFQIKPEERLLSLKFGAEYARYLATVRRWI